MPDMLRRQMDLLRKIPRQSRTTIEELTRSLQDDGYKVSKRTVERDIDLLAEQFPDLEVRKESQPYAIGWSRKALPSFLGMSEYQAVPFLLVDRYLKSALPPPVAEELAPFVQHARAAIPSQNSKHWIRKLRLIQRNSPIPAPVVSNGVARTVFDALVHEECLNISYGRHPDETPESLEVEPYWIIVRDDVQFLIGRRSDNEKIYPFRLHRIRRAKAIAKRAHRPSEDIDTFLRNGGLDGYIEQPIHLHVCFYEGAGDFLFERQLGTEGDVRRSSDSSVELKLKTVLDEPLKWWLLSFADRVKVLAPEGLAQEMKARTRSAAQRYV